MPFDSQRLFFSVDLNTCNLSFALLFLHVYVWVVGLFLPSCLHVGEHRQLHSHCPSTVCHVSPLAKLGPSSLEILVFAVGVVSFTSYPFLYHSSLFDKEIGRVQTSSGSSSNKHWMTE